MTSRTRRDRKIPNSDQLRDRSEWCRRLAVGVADPTLAAQLKMISEEYEGAALKMDRKPNSLEQ